MSKGLLMHYNSLNKFNEIYYKGVLTDVHLDPNEYCFKKLTLPDGDVIENVWGFIFKKDNDKYILKSTDNDGNTLNLKDLLPIKPSRFQKVSFNQDVYYLIEGYKKVKYKSEPKLSFKECISRLNPFEHTNVESKTLFTIAVVAQYFDRANIRFSTPPGFGKDSANDVLGTLIGKSDAIVSPTAPKLEKLATTNELIAVNEIVDLTPAKWKDIEQFLLDCGAFKTEVTKRSRETDGVGEVIDISTLSIALFYNDIDCYPIDSKYMDEISKEAILDRFLPLRFEGVITEDFNKINQVNIDELINNNMDFYKDIIYSLEYWSSTSNKTFVEKGFDISPVNISKPRWVRSLTTINKYIAMFAQTKSEFDYYKKAMEECVEEYNSMVQYKNVCIEKHGNYILKNKKLFKERLLSLNEDGKEEKIKGLEEFS